MFHLDIVWTFHGGSSVKQIDVILIQLFADGAIVGGGDPVEPLNQGGDLQPFFEFEIKHSGIAFEPHDGLSRFEQCFAWDGATVNAGASRVAVAFDDRNVFAGFGRLDGCLLAAWSAADHRHIKVQDIHKLSNEFTTSVTAPRFSMMASTSSG